MFSLYLPFYFLFHSCCSHALVVRKSMNMKTRKNEISQSNRGRRQARKSDTWKKYSGHEIKKKYRGHEIKKSRRPSYTARVYIPPGWLLPKVVNILPNLPNPTPIIHSYPEWPHRQGGCLTCWGCTFESSWVHWFILCTRRSGGTAHEGGGCDQSIGSTVSDAIVRSWLWLTTTRSSPLGCFSILQVVDNWPHILW